IEEIQRVRHKRCTRAFSLSGRPVGITSVYPFARTITISSMPTTARSSLSAQITEFLTSSPSVTLPTVTLPRASRRRTRSSASQDPMSSHANVPVSTAKRAVRSSTDTSTATGVTAAKKRGAFPLLSTGSPGGGAEGAVVTDGPVRVQRQHLAARVVFGDPVRRPRERRCSGRGARLGEDVGLGHVRYRGRDAIHQRGTGEDQGALGGHEAAQARDCLRQQRPVAGQRQELFRPFRGRERPESRSRSAGEDRGPRAHVGSGCASPNITAIRWVSFVGLNGFVTSVAPSRRTSRKTRSSPSAVRTRTGSVAVRPFWRRTRRKSSPEPS